MSDFKNFYVVTIGSSAGGLEALSQLLSALPPKTPKASIIIAQHSSPAYKSQLATLLARKTTIPIEEAKDKQALKVGSIYIIPSNTDLMVEKGRIKLVKPNSIHHPSIDRLFESVAGSYGSKAIGIILSGTGSDGTKGIRAIKANNGFTYAQHPHEATYKAMPQQAILTGKVDLVASIKDIARHLVEHLADGDFSGMTVEQMEEWQGGVEERILKRLSIHKGIDFGNYKTATIQRRMVRRANQLHLNNLEAYFNHIKSDTAELDILYREFLISVTSFFRDKNTFVLLREKLIQLIEGKKRGDFIRIWVPGCATGEEAYTLAIILAEILGPANQDFNVQILASDIDENALQKARKGIYSADSVKLIEKDLAEKYFIKTEDAYEITKQIRSQVLFSKHDLTAQPPFFKIDLISCRNLLIYINQRIQAQIMESFHYALNPDGLLLLGKSESVGNAKDLFVEEDTRNKLYRKSSSFSKRPVFSIPLTSSAESDRTEVFSRDAQVKELMKDTLFRFFDSPFALVDAEMNLIHLRGDLFPFITLRPGMMSSHIVHLADECIQIELRTLLTQTQKEKAPGRSKIKRKTIAEKECIFRLHVFPVPAEKSREDWSLIVFELFEGAELPTGDAHHPAELPGNQRVRELEDELRETKSQLKSFIEQLEASNGEMQALNEELQSANEELQASNEELETSNEELQSVSEEMLVAYNELQELHRLLEEKDKRLQKSSNQFQTLLDYSDQAYMLIDLQYRIVTFNKQSNYLIERTNVRRLKESESIFNYIPSNYLSSFKENLDLAFSGKSTILEDFVPSVKGDVWLRVKYAPVYGQGNVIENVLVSYIDLTDEIRASKLIAHSEANLVSFIENTNGIIYSIDTDYRYVIVNSNFRTVVKASLGEDIRPGDHAFNFLKKIYPSEYESWSGIYERAFRGEFIQFVKEFNLTHQTQYWQFFINPIKQADKIIGLSCSGYDKTDKILSERKIRESETRFRSLIENSNDLISMIDEAGRTIYASPSLKRITEIDSVENNESYWFSILRLEDMGTAREALEVALKFPNVPIHRSLRLKSKDGKCKYVEGTFTNLLEIEGVHAIVTNFKDVTERISAEEEIKKHQGFFRAVIENSQDMKALFAADGRIKYASPSISKVLGFQQEELGQTSLFELVHLDEVEKFGERVQQLFLTPNGALTLELRIRHKNGHYVWCEGTLTNLLHNSYVEGVVCNFRDISQRKQAEEEQRALIDELVRRNRDLQQFSYITSHNLRAPVANMIGLMSLYNKENPCDPNNVVLIENVEWSINQLNGTLSDLVRIIVIKNNVNIEQESLALEAVYQTVYQSIEQTVLESQAQIKVDFSQVPQLVYNRIHLESIFLNLLTNAIRYRSPDRPLEIGITSQHRGGYVEIDFADNGLGIDLARYQERLFGLYQRFHNHPESKGLGLYIVKSEVTALGGRIEVESEVGKGTTFKVFLKTHYNDYPSGSITRG